jgi:hypothetical protein
VISLWEIACFNEFLVICYESMIVSSFNDMWNLYVKSSLIGCWVCLPFLNSLLPEAKQPQNLIYCACSECSANFEVWENFCSWVFIDLLYSIHLFLDKEIKTRLICKNEAMGLCCSIIITFCFIIISSIWWSWWNKKWVCLVDLSTVYEHGFMMNNDDRI